MYQRLVESSRPSRAGSIEAGIPKAGLSPTSRHPALRGRAPLRPVGVAAALALVGRHPALRGRAPLRPDVLRPLQLERPRSSRPSRAGSIEAQLLVDTPPCGV